MVKETTGNRDYTHELDTHDTLPISPSNELRELVPINAPEAPPSADNPQSDSSSVRALLPLFFSVFMFFTGVAMTYPVRPLLILKASGNSAIRASVFTGAVDSLQAVITIFCSPLLGAVSDVIGRKPVLSLAHLGELVALMMIAQFPTNLWLQFPAYLLVALTNAYYTTANTIVADISVDSVISSRNYGWLGACFGVCFMVGPVLGGAIEDRYYLASSFHGACVLIFFAMIFAHYGLPETNTVATEGLSLGDIAAAVRETEFNPLPRVKRILSQSEGLKWTAYSLAITSLAHSSLNSILFLYAQVKLGWGAKDTGMFLSALGLSLFISQSIIAPLAVKWFGEGRTIVVCYGLSVVHFCLYGAAQSSASMYVALFVGMLSFSADPPMKSLIARQVERKEQGGLQGSVSGLSAVVKPLSPLFAAGLFGLGIHIGVLGLPFYGMAVLSMASMALIQIALRKPDLK